MEVFEFIAEDGLAFGSLIEERGLFDLLGGIGADAVPAPGIDGGQELGIAADELRTRRGLSAPTIGVNDDVGEGLVESGRHGFHGLVVLLAVVGTGRVFAVIDRRFILQAPLHDLEPLAFEVADIFDEGGGELAEERGVELLEGAALELAVALPIGRRRPVFDFETFDAGGGLHLFEVAHLAGVAFDDLFSSGVCAAEVEPHGEAAVAEAAEHIGIEALAFGGKKIVRDGDDFIGEA